MAWYDLPPELIIRIVEFASQSAESCLALCLVSSWTRRIALPLLLETVVLDRARDLEAFAETVKTKSPVKPFSEEDHPALLVRNMSIAPLTTSSMAPLQDIVERCANIRNWRVTDVALLAIYAATGDAAALHRQLMAHARPRRVMKAGIAPPSHLHDVNVTIYGHPNWTVLRYIPRGVHAGPFPRHITHLTLTSHCPIPHAHRDISNLLDDLPHLTHLATSVNATRWHVEAFDRVRSRVEKLQMLVYIFDADDPDMQSEVFQPEMMSFWRERLDHKIWFVRLSLDEDQGLWKDEVQGGQSIWHRAVQDTTDWLTSVHLESLDLSDEIV